MTIETFETTECHRCGGTGRYPSSVWGGKCFTCSGSGRKLTRSGAAAVRAALDWNAEHLTVPVSEIKPGMVIYVHDGWRSVVSVSEPIRMGERDGLPIYWVEVVTPTVTVSLEVGREAHGMPEVTVLRAPTAEEKEAKHQRLLRLKGYMPGTAR